MFKRPLIAFSFSLLLCASCQSSVNNTSVPPVSTPGTSTAPSAPDIETLKTQFLQNYAQNVYLNYQDTYTHAVALQAAVDALIAKPDADTLAQAKSAWIEARVPYAQSEGYRFYDGPIDGEEGPEPHLNAWPMDEVYVDYVEGQPNAGIVNQVATYPTIDAALLKQLNEAGGDKNISTGYHAIEFLLWGQDLTVGAGAGERPFTDYTTAANADRRATYLKVVTDLLVSDLKSVMEAWAPDQNNYRRSFLAMDADTALAKVLKGIGTLSSSELSSERMATPLDIGDREEEHSCFSDNTRDDVMYNAQSIRNVLTGQYAVTGTDTVHEGPGLLALMESADPDLASRLKASSEKVLELTQAIQSPFDQEIRPDNEAGKARVLSAIQELQAQGRLIVEAGQVLGIQVNTDL
jgi:putative iron-regulated protein